MPAALNNCIKKEAAQMFRRSPHLEPWCSHWSVRRPREWVKPSPPPSSLIKGSRLGGGSTSTGCSPQSLTPPPSSSHSLSLSPSRWLAGFAIKPAPGESNAPARCFLPLPGKDKKHNVGRCWISDGTQTHELREAFFIKKLGGKRRECYFRRIRALCSFSGCCMFR